MLGAVETSAIGRMFAQKHGYRFDANQELLALGAGNLLSGLGRGFPVSGGMSQSLVNESFGARTPLSGLIAALFTLVVVLFASGLLRNLPQPVLAAIVLAAVMTVRRGGAEAHLALQPLGVLRVDRGALGVLGSGPVNGVLLGAAISIVLLLRQAARPRVTELARFPGTMLFADRSRHPDTAVEPGLLVVRCESALLYFNVEYVRERLFEILNARTEPVRLVVFALGTVPNIDLAGAEFLADLLKTFRARSIAFFAWPTPAARCAPPWGASTSNASTDRSKGPDGRRRRVRLARNREVGLRDIGGPPAMRSGGAATKSIVHVTSLEVLEFQQVPPRLPNTGGRRGPCSISRRPATCACRSRASSVARLARSSCGRVHDRQQRDPSNRRVDFDTTVNAIGADAPRR